MANIKSQKKRIITNEKARMRNRAVRSELKTAIRTAREAVEAGNGAEAYAAGVNACRLLDKAASKGIIHKNQAANRKSNLMKLVNTVATDEDRAAYTPVKHENVAKGGSKKAAAKAARRQGYGRCRRREGQAPRCAEGSRGQGIEEEGRCRESRR
ncbi:MAG: 30S ribosomal protein S20 [Eggerthellaceae bacterium]